MLALLIIVFFLVNTFANHHRHYSFVGRTSGEKFTLQKRGQIVKRIHLVWRNQYVYGIRVFFTDNSYLTVGDMRRIYGRFSRSYTIPTTRLGIQGLRICRHRYYFSYMRLYMNGRYYTLGHHAAHCVNVATDNNQLIGLTVYRYGSIIGGLGAITKNVLFKDRFIGYKYGANYNGVMQRFRAKAVVTHIYTWNSGYYLRGIAFKFSDDNYQMIGTEYGTRRVVTIGNNKIAYLAICYYGPASSPSYVTGFYMRIGRSYHYHGYCPAYRRIYVPYQSGYLIGAKAFYHGYIRTLSLRMLKSTHRKIF